MSNKPTYRLYFVQKFKRDGEDKSHWIECGAGWVQKDGDGVSITVQHLPIGFFGDGRLVLRATPEVGDNAA